MKKNSIEQTATGPAGLARAALAALTAWGLALCLAGCALPEKPADGTVYDFGPGLSDVGAAPAGPVRALVMSAVDAPSAFDNNALSYRLAYADPQQLRPYAQARWSMPPAQLVRQRLRSLLGQARPVLNLGEGIAQTRSGPPLLLRLELEEFSQMFDSPTSSRGLIRLRASLLETREGREQLLEQRVLVLQRPAPSADAAGGVRALTAATDGLALELNDWLKAWR